MPRKKLQTKEEVLSALRAMEARRLSYAAYSSVYINPQFLADRDFLLEAVKVNGNLLNKVEEPLKYDRELLLTAAQNSPDSFALRYKLPQEILSDYGFMLKLVEIKGKFLWQYFASRNYSQFTEKEKKLILAAVANDYEAFDDINISGNFNCCRDKEFALELVGVNGNVFKYFCKELRGDKNIVLKAVENNYRLFEFATNNLRGDEKFIRRAIEVNACCLAFAPAYMREDRELVTRLMQKTPFVYRYAKGEMRNDASLALQAVKCAPELYHYLEYEMTNENMDFILGLAKFASAEDTPTELKQFFKSRLRSVWRYREWRSKNPDLDGDLSELLLLDDAGGAFTTEYNLDINFKDEINKYIPEVVYCYNQKQRGVWHIYNVMGHILHSVEEMNKLTAELAENERKLLAFTMFFHDLGKPEYHKVKRKNGKLCDSFFGHNIGSEKIAKRVLRHLKFNKSEQKIILTLVREHDLFLKFSDEPKEDWQVKPTVEYLKEYIKSLNKFGDGKKIFEYLILVGIADNKAQNPKMTKDSLEMIERIASTAKEIQVN